MFQLSCKYLTKEPAMSELEAVPSQAKLCASGAASTASMSRESTIASGCRDDKPTESSDIIGDLHTYVANTLRFFDNPDLSDTILLVGEHRFYAHKFALASQSDVFHEMMIVSDECTGYPGFQKEMELNETEDCQKVFSKFLRFFYCGKIALTRHTVLPLLVLSEKYKVEALRAACDGYITDMIRGSDLKSATEWLRYATMNRLQDLAIKCVDGAIADNVEELMDSPSWLALSTECMEAVLQSSYLLLSDEYILFESVQRWFLHKRKSNPDDEIVHDLQKVLRHIRFSQMHSNELLAVEESVVGLNYRSITQVYLSDAYRYQILVKQCSDFKEVKYLPRDYTNKRVCSIAHFNPAPHRKTSQSVHSADDRWEIQPRRFYDTVNIVIVLKKPLQRDIKVFISILMYKRNGDILMRLRRKPCLLRPVDLSSSTSSPVNRTSVIENKSHVQRQTAMDDHGLHSTAVVKAGDGLLDGNRKPNRTLHQKSSHVAARLHGPQNGQEYYAIDNIVSAGDFQMALNHSGNTGLKFGIIIRTWSVVD